MRPLGQLVREAGTWFSGGKSLRSERSESWDEFSGAEALRQRIVAERAEVAETAGRLRLDTVGRYPGWVRDQAVVSAARQREASE